ncbi:hypothetical protein P3L10_031670 [Capsicum annuum]
MGYNQFSFLFFLCLCLLSLSSSIPHHLCRRDESISLLKFKKKLTVNSSVSSDGDGFCETFYNQMPHQKTSSWKMSRDCCSWDGVTCDEMIGHVIELNLSCSQLVGKIDSNSNLFQLSHLQRLDLFYNNFPGSHIFPEFDSSRFSSLTHLNLFKSSFSGQIPLEISHLSKLQSLSLSPSSETNLRLAARDFKLLFQNLTKLTDLQLKGINISSTISLNFFSHLTTLRLLSLSNCNLRGPIPKSLSNLTRLELLVLDGNTLNGTMPSWMFSQLPSLRYLILSNNHFSGQLEDFKSNSLSGYVDVSLFSDLKQLRVLDLSYNSISLTNENKVNVTWLESLDKLGLAACEVKELEFLRSAKQLQELDLSNNKIQGRIPVWAWSNWMFSMRSSLPIPPNTTWLFFISQNNMSGEIPSSICNLTSLEMLDLGRNNLRGEIPQCLGNMTALGVLDIRHNNLSGNLPTTFISGSSLTSLNLHGNKLEGKIPRSLAHCKELEVLDLGDNHLIGTFPMWLGTLPKLQVLSLRSNELHGSIRTSTIENMFPNLRMLDLSSNAFTGNLPKSLLQHLKAMRTIDPSKMEPRDGYYQDTVAVVTKGLELEVVRILSLYTTVDLSNNKFEGHIPSIVGDLVTLRVLNLSHNGLEGHIPLSLGNLSVVELSYNHLSGEIPQQLASLTFLSFLNLSHNHLRGCIPQEPQFATFENYSYEGNDGLRGFPVSKVCGDDHVSNTVSGLDDQEGDSEFLNDFRKAALMGYGSGLCVGLSIIYMVSTRNPIWLARIILKLEHKIITRRKKKQRLVRNNKRRNNHL